ncbi:hypothetical protein Hanom_Chr10g00899811 [Helianthus anomalus]
MNMKTSVILQLTLAYTMIPTKTSCGSILRMLEMLLFILDLDKRKTMRRSYKSNLCKFLAITCC